MATAETNDRLERLISREKDSWREFKDCIEHLKLLTQRVKTEGVKEGIDKAGSVYYKLMKQRTEIHAEVRAKLHAAEKIVESAYNKVTDRIEASETKMLTALEGVAAKVADQCSTLDQVQHKLTDQEVALSTLTFPPDSTRERASERVGAFEEKVMGVLGQVSGKLAEQDVVLAKLTGPGTHIQPDQPKWTEVVRRHKGKATTGRGENLTVDTDTEKRSGLTNANRPARPPRARPLAIMVARDEAGFPELLKTVRRTVDPAVTGNAIAKMRKTTSGKLLIEINGGNDAAETVRQEIVRSLGPTAKVRRMANESPIEIRDLDDETSGEEVLEAVSAQIGEESAQLVSLRRTYGDAKTAVVVLPSEAAKRLCTAGRIRVGLVYARVRHAELPPRCLRCLAFGHLARSCTGRDRTGKCWKCGDDGHFGRECAANTVKQAAFRESLLEDGKLGRHKSVEESGGSEGNTTEGAVDAGKDNRDG